MGRQAKIVTQFYSAVGDTPEEAERLVRLLVDMGTEKRPGRPFRADRLGVAFAIARCIPPSRWSPKERRPHRGVVPMREENAASALIMVFASRRDANGHACPDTITLENATQVIEQARKIMTPTTPMLDEPSKIRLADPENPPP